MNKSRVSFICLVRIVCFDEFVIEMMASSNGNIFRVTGHLCGEFPTQRPITRSFDVYFDLRTNKRLSKQSWRWWFETPSRPLWHHRNGDDTSGKLFLVANDSYRKYDPICEMNCIGWLLIFRYLLVALKRICWIKWNMHNTTDCVHGRYPMILTISFLNLSSNNQWMYILSLGENRQHWWFK